MSRTASLLAVQGAGQSSTGGHNLSQTTSSFSCPDTETQATMPTTNTNTLNTSSFSQTQLQFSFLNLVWGFLLLWICHLYEYQLLQPSTPIFFPSLLSATIYRQELSLSKIAPPEITYPYSRMSHLWPPILSLTGFPRSSCLICPHKVDSRMQVVRMRHGRTHALSTPGTS